MPPRPRGARTKGAWLLVVPFFLFSRPGAGALLAGAGLTAIGLVIRAWSAGTIRKDESLTTWGPYAFVRHPLYLGSFLIGIGLGIAGGHWIWPAAVVAYFVLVYGRTVDEEAERLTELFGHRYVEYATRVPALLPRLGPYRAPANALAWPSGSVAAQGADPAAAGEPKSGGEELAAAFSWGQYLRNREWEALLGALAAFTILAAKMRWMG